MKRLIVGLMFCVSIWGQAIGTNTAVISTPPPSGVQANQTFVSTTGTLGQTQWCYWVVTVYNIGMAQPGGPVCIGNANGTLSGSNYNTITWTAPSGSAIGYWVIASNSSVFPSTGVNAVNTTVLSASTLTLNHQSNTLHSFTMSSAPFAYYQLAVNNKDFSLPVVQIQDANGNVQYQWYMNGNIHHKVESVEGNVTVAALHAVPVIVTPVLGTSLRIVGVLFQAVGGSAATCTSVQVTDTAGTPIVGVQAPAANLTSGTVNNEATANMVLTTFLTNLTAGQGLELSDSGGQCTTMTSLNYRILYKALP